MFETSTAWSESLSETPNGFMFNFNGDQRPKHPCTCTRVDQLLLLLASCLSLLSSLFRVSSFDFLLSPFFLPSLLLLPKKRRTHESAHGFRKARRSGSADNKQGSVAGQPWSFLCLPRTLLQTRGLLLKIKFKHYTSGNEPKGDSSRKHSQQRGTRITSSSNVVAQCGRSRCSPH